jgi:hypothetical protein
MKPYPYLIVAIWAVAAAMVLLYAPRTDSKRIDCSQAEFHPDFTAEMKEQCRLARSERLL